MTVRLLWISVLRFFRYHKYRTGLFTDFFDNLRKDSQGTIEDPIFAFRAVAPVLACHESLFEQKTVYWDPVAVKKAKG